MTVTARVNAYRAAVVATVRTAMPDLRECAEQFGRFDLGELETNSVWPPAVRIAVLNAKVKPAAAGQPDADLTCAAFVITEGKDRDRQAWAIAEAIAVLLHPGQLFGVFKMGGPTQVQIQPVISAKVKAKAVSIIAVEWRQELRQLGDAIFDDEKHLLTELYVNGAEVDVDA